MHRSFANFAFTSAASHYGFGGGLAEVQGTLR